MSDDRNSTTFAWVTLGGAIALFIGSFLPWASVDTVFGSVSKNGTSGDGVFTIIGAALIAPLVFPAVKQPVARGRVLAVCVVAGLALLVCVVDIVDVNRIADEAGAEIDVGFGLWLCAVGAAAAVIGSLLLMVDAKKKTASLGPTAPTWTPPPPVGPPDDPAARPTHRPADRLRTTQVGREGIEPSTSGLKVRRSAN